MKKFKWTLPGLILSLLFAQCGNPGSESGNPGLKVCTFNIRFDNPKDGISSWDNRRESVVSFLAIESPDILGMQEVLARQLKYIESELPAYSRVGVGREDGKSAGEFVPVLYKKERFELIDSGNFWLSETPGEPSIGWDAQIKRVCTYVFLNDKESGEEIHIYNTHFSHIGPQARLKSAELIMDSIEHYSSGERVVLTGDFNTEPGTEPYMEITSNGFSDSFYSKKTLGPVGTFNGFQLEGPHNSRIDFIFTRRFDPEYYVSNSMLINNSYLSDHFPVLAMFYYSR